jgi:adenosylcobyric acid synthase
MTVQKTRSLMVLGTASHVGKSMLTAALCRIFMRSGVRVAPFKAQNMSLNSAATVDGYEIGRAQALQAEAAGLFATRDMNPILLKPESDCWSQVVVRGRIWKSLSAADYHLDYVKELFPVVLESYRRLADHCELVILEGAGSPAEINLKKTDLVNMRMAAAADAACLLVADIDRGGVFASLLGTMELLDGDERERVRGFVINKFRGDLSLLTPGIREMEERLQRPCVGVVPYIPDLGLDEEDSVGLESRDERFRPEEWAAPGSKSRRLRIAVVRLPYLSNFTDFDALAWEPSVSLQFIDHPRQLEHADVIVLPGTKQTLHDVDWLKHSGLAGAIVARSQDALIIGICGGMQMLGLEIEDPYDMEGGGHVDGLGLLGIRTTLNREKITAQVSARLISDCLFGGPMSERKTAGYEIHLGETAYDGGSRPLFELRRCHEPQVMIDDGAQSMDGRIWGSYVHGLFDDDAFRHAVISNARLASKLDPAASFAFPAAERQRNIDRLADAVKSALDIRTIREWIALPATRSRSKTTVIPA